MGDQRRRIEGHIGGGVAHQPALLDGDHVMRKMKVDPARLDQSLHPAAGGGTVAVEELRRARDDRDRQAVRVAALVAE